MKSTTEELTGHLAEEYRLVTDMIRLTCEKQHGSAKGDLCAACTALLAYVKRRLLRCRYGENKPVCRRCTTHCYRPEERAQIRQVMRFAGPRLLWRGNFAAIKHLLHDRKGVKKPR